MSNLLQLTYLVFNNRDMAKKAECTLRNMQKAQMIAMALSTQRPPTESLVFLGQSDSGRPQGPWVSIKPQCSLCGQKGHWGKDYSWCGLCKYPGHWHKECPRCQRAMEVPQPLMVLQSEDLWSLRLKVTLPRDTIYITNAEPRVVILCSGPLDRISYRHWCKLLGRNPKNWRP